MIVPGGSNQSNRKYWQILYRKHMKYYNFIEVRLIGKRSFVVDIYHKRQYLADTTFCVQYELQGRLFRTRMLGPLLPIFEIKN